jgi:CheY-like chemotaxis protein
MAFVLVVDDEKDVRDLLADILIRAGHTVEKASSGVGALDLLDGDARVDLLLTDIVMPGLNGFNLARMVRERRPTTRVLYLTGYSERLEIMRDNGVRFGTVLLKPIRAKELCAAVAKALALPLIGAELDAPPC